MKLAFASVRSDWKLKMTTFFHGLSLVTRIGYLNKILKKWPELDWLASDEPWVNEPWPSQFQIKIMPNFFFFIPGSHTSRVDANRYDDHWQGPHWNPEFTRACMNESAVIVGKQLADSSPRQHTSTLVAVCEPVFGKKSDDRAFTSSIHTRFGSLWFLSVW